MSKHQPLRLVVIGSGRGSNYEAIQQAIEDKELNAEVVLVLSNKSDAGILEKADRFNVPNKAVVATSFSSHAAYENELLNEVNNTTYDLIVLAGYMKILSADFLNQVKAPIMNIHPSLLPAFPGLHAQKQAVDYGVKISGCTVHFVDAGLDSGPILLQTAVPVYADDDDDSLSARILEEEHRIYPEAIRQFAAGKFNQLQNDKN